MPGNKPIILDASGRPITAQISDPGRDARTVRDPGNPLTPTLPRQIPPRGLIPGYGQNLRAVPRSVGEKSLIAFESLRYLAEWDLVRIAIEDVKGQILGMDWSVGAAAGFEDAEGLQAEIDKVRRWIETPDPLADVDFYALTGAMIEEILTTDALTLIPRFTRRGDPMSLEIIDGATILPLVDHRGRPPVPPAAAYQQIVDGRPETEFTIRELWYLPLSKRVDSPYGRSRTEQVIMTVNVGIRYQDADLSYFADGTVPDSLFLMPENWGWDEITEFQRYWDDLLRGRNEFRSGNMRFAPNGTYVPTKERAWSYDFLEWVARVVAWSFGVSPLPIAKMMNRTTSEVMEISSTESGVRPVAQFVERIYNRWIRRCLTEAPVAFRWGGDEDEDPALAVTRDQIHAGIGAVTLDEIRAQTGRKPYPNGIGSRPLIMTSAGPVLLESAIGGNTESPLPDPRAGQAPDVPPGPSADAAVENGLTVWRRVALDRQKRGKAHKPFAIDGVPALMKIAVQKKLDRARSVEDVVAAFEIGPLKKKLRTPKSRVR